MIVTDIEDMVYEKVCLLNQMPACDLILNSEVSLQMGEEISIIKVIQRALGTDGTVAVTYN